jgi:hypothetical protein
MKALEGGISGSFSTFPTGFNMTSSASFSNFKRQMNEYEMSSDVLAKIGGYQIQRAIEMQEKMDNCYDEAGQSKKVGHYNKPFKGRRKKNAQESK